MNPDKPKQSAKVLCAFMVGNVVTAVFFVWCVTRPALQDYWFRTEEIWTFPTGKLWLLSTGLFVLNLVGAYSIAHLKGWLSFPANRLIIGAIVITFAPGSIWFIGPRSALAQVLLFRFMLAILLSLALVVITKNWYWSLAILMLVSSLATPLVAGLPHVLFKSIRFEWFEVSKFFVNSLLLSVFSGYWLVKSSP